jgi:hypothetical protein
MPNQIMTIIEGKIKKYKLPSVLNFTYEDKEYRIERKSSPQFITLHGWGSTLFHNDFIKKNKRIYDMIENKETKTNTVIGKSILRGDEFTHFIHEYLVEHILRFYSVDESIINAFTHIDYHSITRLPMDVGYLEFHIKTNKINASKFVKMYGMDDTFLHRHLDDTSVMNFGKTKNDITKMNLNFGSDTWINYEFITLLYMWIRKPNLGEYIIADKLMTIQKKVEKYYYTSWYSFYEEIIDENNNLKDLKMYGCSICLDNAYCMDVYETECGHMFHKKCIRDYFLLHRHDNCPDCRDIFRIVVESIPKKTVKKYRKLLAPLILNNKNEYRVFFKKHYVKRFDDLLV